MNCEFLPLESMEGGTSVQHSATSGWFSNTGIALPLLFFILAHMGSMKATPSSVLELLTNSALGHH